MNLRILCARLWNRSDAFHNHQSMKSIQACDIEKIPGKIMVKPRQGLILVVRTTSVTASRGKLCAMGNDRDFVPQITRRRFGTQLCVHYFHSL